MENIELENQHNLEEGQIQLQQESDNDSLPIEQEFQFIKKLIKSQKQAHQNMIMKKKIKKIKQNQVKFNDFTQQRQIKINQSIEINTDILGRIISVELSSIHQWLLELSIIIIIISDQQNPQFPMLVSISKKSFFEELNNLQTSEDKFESKKLPKAVRRFYCKKTFLFSKFYDGIMLDEESWYSVIPEVLIKQNIIIKCISQKIAEQLLAKVKYLNLKQVKVVDCFCGSGGLAIQLASRFTDFEAIDIDPIKIKNIKNNMKIYGQDFQVHEMSFFDFPNPENSQTILTICPPWGGTQYLKKPKYDLMNHMNPNLLEILDKAFDLSQLIVLQLPKNTDIKQLISVFQQVQDKKALKMKRFCFEIEQYYVNEQINQLIIYFGDLSSIYYSVECQKLYEVLLNDEIKQKKESLKKELKSSGIVEIYKKVVLDDQINIPEIVKPEKKKKCLKNVKKNQEQNIENNQMLNQQIVKIDDI